MKKKQLHAGVLTFILVFFVGMNVFAKTTNSKKPNIIFILTDDQHRHEFNFLSEGKTVDGQVSNLSPTLDRLVSEGILCGNGYMHTIALFHINREVSQQGY